jgi:peptidoglycan DL-endopeptidase CwlO
MRKLICMLALLTCGTLCAQAPDSIRTNPLGDSIVSYAKTFLGTPYKYGCASGAGFDCSGFTWYVFAHFGLTVPRSSKDYKTFGQEVPISQSRKGDIIVFRGTHAGDEAAGHVGIVISNPGEPLRFIHSSSSGSHSGVVITDYYGSAYPKRFIKICRVF